MGFNFPNAPTIDQLWPSPPVDGQPVYRWDGEKWTSSGVSEKTYAPIDALGWSGMQINGSMEVSQERGSTALVTNLGYVVDGWKFYSTAGLFSSQQSPYGSSKQIVVTVTTPVPSLAASDATTLYQMIEGYRLARLNWGTAKACPITIGFWTAHKRTGTYSVAVRLQGGSPRSYATTYIQNVADAYEYKTVTIPGCLDGVWPSDNIVGMEVLFTLASGATFTAPVANAWQNGSYLAAPGQVNGVAASDVFRITGVVVLPGIEAPSAERSPLIMRPYDQELLTCQRYYRIVMPDIRFYAHGGGEVVTNTFQVPDMRALATAAVVTAGTMVNTNASYTYINPLTVRDIRSTMVSLAVGDTFAFGRTYSCDARL